MPQGFCAGQRALKRQRGEIGLADQRRLQLFVILATRYLCGAKRLQVIGDELRIEQCEAANAQPRHEMYQRHLGSVARVVEHALPEEGPGQTDTVKASNKFIPMVDLDTVAMAAFVQFGNTLGTGINYMLR